MRAASLLALAGLVIALAPALQAEPAAGALALSIECFLPPVRAMEFSYSDPTCWNHGGHHHYFLGRDTTYLLRGVTGLAFVVEQEFSVPTEDPLPVLSPGPLNAGVHSPVAVETSLDGKAWQAAGTGRYRYLDLAETLACDAPCLLDGRLWRQDVLFDIAGQGQEFRFIRVRQPYSHVTQGLSGFLDHTRLQVSVDPGTPVPPPALAPGARDLPCEAAMEAISPDHPCWFGGLDRYDSPSYFHTWFLGDAVLQRASFNATVLPWRSDDFFAPVVLPRLPNVLLPPLGPLPPQVPPAVPGLPAPPDPGALAAAAERLRATLQTNVTLQASVDGQSWTDLLRVYGPFGAEVGGAVDLAGVRAKFLRLVPEKHHRYDDFEDFAANHHPRGFLFASDVHVEGLLAP